MQEFKQQRAAVSRFGSIMLSRIPLTSQEAMELGDHKGERKSPAVLLTPLPNEKAGLRYQIRSDRFPWPTAIPKRIVAIRESGEVLWDRPLADDGTFQHDEQAFAYRLEP